nr:MAG TPA: hypothetical protein [Bacteriophage sp.]
MTAGVKSCVRFYRVGRSDIRGSGRQNQPYSKKLGWGELAQPLTKRQ